jgi:signal transduction histidine kinase
VDRLAGVGLSRLTLTSELWRPFGILSLTGSGMVSVRSERLEDWVLISVQDTGTGIDPESAERIFDAFYTTKPHGIGLGLSICRSIVESHGGRLTASPVSPFGSMFQVWLPAAPIIS